MNSRHYLFPLLLLMLAGCNEQRAPAPSTPAASSAADSPASVSSGESPAVTASSAAAAAPECKDMARADPKACKPSETGDPSAR